MSRIEVEFAPERGIIFKKISANDVQICHEVPIGTLKQMSLADLEYCLSSNIIMELVGLQNLFADYLFLENSDSKRKSKTEPR